jgi:NADPH-dependent 7-cyano-7-deazaguanine reductase QueF-like protein
MIKNKKKYFDLHCEIGPKIAQTRKIIYEITNAIEDMESKKIVFKKAFKRLNIARGIIEAIREDLQNEFIKDLGYTAQGKTSTEIYYLDTSHE